MNIIDFVNTLKDGDYLNNIASFEEYLKGRKFKFLKQVVYALEDLTQNDIERKFGRKQITIDVYGIHDPISGEIFENYKSLNLGPFSVFGYADCKLLDITLQEIGDDLVAQLEV